MGIFIMYNSRKARDGSANDSRINKWKQEEELFISFMQQ